MISEEEADRLAQVACELVQRVRDDEPDANLRWLRATLPDPAERERLVFVLAIAVPDDRTWRALTAWTREQESSRVLRPHGTPAAAKRHRYHGEPLCADCRDAERDRERERARRRRAA